MIDIKAIEQLREVGKKVKEIAPDLNGQVIFNCAKQMLKPKVTIVAYDATEVKK
jgi:hypothetical protein